MSLEAGSPSIPDRLAEFLELAGRAYLLYKTASPDEKRDLVKIVTSNRQVSRKSVEFTLSVPFNEVANSFQRSNGRPYRDRPRTLDRLVKKLRGWFNENPAPVLGATMCAQDTNSPPASKTWKLAA